MSFIVRSSKPRADDDLIAPEVALSSDYPSAAARTLSESDATPVPVPLSERAARGVTAFTGSTPGLLLAVAAILVWGAAGPFFGFSADWQLVINTGTTIVTFLMVFLIQRSQNKDSTAIHLKLNELIAAVQGASSRLVTAEDLPEDDLRLLQREYRALVEIAKKQGDTRASRSIDESSAPAEGIVPPVSP